jgi:hypothetical protein
VHHDINVISGSYAGWPPPRNSCWRVGHRRDRPVVFDRGTRRAVRQGGPPLPVDYHGDEIGQGRIGIIGIDPMSIYQSELLTGWGDVTLLANEVVELSGDARSTWQHPGVTVKETPTDRIDGHAKVVGKGAMAALLWLEIVHPLQVEAATP